MPTASRGIAIQLRDIAILTMVYLYGGVTREQIARRYFPTPYGLQSCYRRIEYFIKQELLKIAPAKIRAGHGSTPDILTLGNHGREVLADYSALPRTALARSVRLKKPSYTFHHNGINDVRLAIELATEHFPWVQLSNWLPIPHGTLPTLHVADPTDGADIPLRADGSFTLTTPKAAVSFFLEVDMGTITAIVQKIRGYILFNRKREHREPVLWVTPTAARQKELAALVLAQAHQLQETHAVHYLTTFNQLTERSILTEPIWQVAGSDRLHFLVKTPPPVFLADTASSQLIQSQ